MEHKHLSYQLTPVIHYLCWPRLKKFTLLVNVEWPTFPPTILVAKATACHPPSGLISVDDDFEELQRGFAPKETNADTKKCVKLFNDWASARSHHSTSTIKMVLNDILLTDTTLQLLKVVMLQNSLGGWQAFAFATRMLERLGHSTFTQC